MGRISELNQQSNRLQFEDPELEAKFLAERYAQSLTRMRILFGLSTLVVAVIGLQEAHSLDTRAPEYSQLSLASRFFVLIPIYILMALATWLPGAQRRVDWMVGVGITTVCWTLGYTKWRAVEFFELHTVLSVLQLDLLVTLLISVIALPLRWITVLLMCLTSTLGVTLLFNTTHLSGDFVGQTQLASSLTAFVTFGIVLQWFRERNGRRMFGQRERMAELNSQLEQLNRERSEFMMIAAHDLRSPLSSIKLSLEGLENKQGRAGPCPELQAMRQQIDRMLRLVNNFLSARAIKKGDLEVWTEPFHITELVQRVVKGFGSRAKSKQQEIATRTPDEDFLIESDPDLVQQVIENYVSNALKFSPPGSRITIGIEPQSDSAVRVAVMDEGPGIDAEDQARLFQSEGRAKAQPTGGEPSHGLGLSAVRRIARAINAAHGCESQPGQGATFWITLPRYLE